MELLRSFCGRADEEKYRLMLLAVFKLFGIGIVESLEYTMKDYLKQTNGDYQWEGRATWEVEAATKMLCHNNAAERPFAVLRQYKRMYPSLPLGNLCKLIQRSWDCYQWGPHTARVREFPVPSADNDHWQSH
jgi:hypothetical protein